MANFSRSFPNFSNRSFTIDLSSDEVSVEISPIFNGANSTGSESSRSSFSSSSSTNTSSSLSSSSTSTTGFSSSESSTHTTVNNMQHSDLDGSVEYSVRIDDSQSNPNVSVSINRNAGQNSNLSIDISQVEADIERINRFCSEVMSSISPETRGTTNSTPRMGRRVFDSAQYNAPVEVIDLLNVDDSNRRTPVNRVPEAVIDLCTPVRRNLPTATIDLDDSDIPTSRRRVHASSSTPITARTTLDVDDSVVSPPKRNRCERNESSDDVYKCPVCLESVRHREPLSTKCGHVFCRECIETAIRTTHKCPMCNKKLSIRQLSQDSSCYTAGDRAPVHDSSSFMQKRI